MVRDSEDEDLTVRLGGLLLDTDTKQKLEDEVLNPLRERARRDIAREFELLLGTGVTPAQAIDIWFTERWECSQSEVARMRGVSPQAVHDSLERAYAEHGDALALLDFPVEYNNS